MVATPDHAARHRAPTRSSGRRLADDGDVARGDLDVHRRRRRDAVADPGRDAPRPSAAPSAAPTPVAVAARPVRRSPRRRAALGRRQRHGERQRRRPADHRRPDRPRRRGRLPPEPTQPPARPDVIRGADWARLARPGVGGAARRSVARRSPCVLPAAGGGATRSTRPTRAGCRWRSTSSARPLTVALSFVFVIVRDVRAAPPDLDADGHAAAGLAALSRSARSASFGWVWIIAQGIAGGSSDGDVATLFLWVYGWVGLAIMCAHRRTGLALPRPVLDAPRPRRRGPARGSASRAGRSPTTRSALGRWPATIGFAFFVWLELVVLAGAVDAVHRARRLHRA